MEMLTIWAFYECPGKEEVTTWLWECNIVKPTEAKIHDALSKVGWTEEEMPESVPSDAFDRKLPFGAREIVYVVFGDVTQETVDKTLQACDSNGFLISTEGYQDWITSTGHLMSKWPYNSGNENAHWRVYIFKGEEEILYVQSKDRAGLLYTHGDMAKIAAIVGEDVPRQWRCPCGCQWTT